MEDKTGLWLKRNTNPSEYQTNYCLRFKKLVVNDQKELIFTLLAEEGPDKNSCAADQFLPAQW